MLRSHSAAKAPPSSTDTLVAEHRVQTARDSPHPPARDVHRRADADRHSDGRFVRALVTAELSVSAQRVGELGLDVAALERIDASSITDSAPTRPSSPYTSAPAGKTARME
jgi:hypothetical protein